MKNGIEKETAESIVDKFVGDYKRKREEIGDAEWLDAEFSEYPDLWKDEEERKSCSTDIVEGVRNYRTSADGLADTLSKGGKCEDFLERRITDGCAVEGVVLTGNYATKIDTAIDEANKLMAEQVYTHNNGVLDPTHVNESSRMHGNMAEAEHANQFNIDAATKESRLHAEVPSSHGKNSVDILIKDADGKIVRKYQSKYGADAQATERQFGNDYRGQRKLAPEDQAQEIPGATDHIEADGVKSKPLSKKEAVEMQNKAQKTGKSPVYDWTDAGTKAIVKHIGKKAAISGFLAIGFQAGRVLGRRAWNAITGKKNKSIKEDLKEFAESAAKSGAAATGMTAVCGGLMVAAKKGLLGTAMKSVKGNVIANAACAAVENLKILHKYGKGEISGIEALDMAGRANCSLVGSLVCAGKGAAAGAAVCAALGPVGVAVGGFVGGVAGCITGGFIGEAVYSVAKKICRAVANIGSACMRGISSVARGIGSFFGLCA